MSLHWGHLVVLLCYDCTNNGNLAYANINFLPRRQLIGHSNTTQSTKNTKQTTTNMSRHHPTLQWLCNLSPWQRPPWTQILAPLIPMGPYKACGVGCALIAVCSFVWGAKMQHIKNQRDGCDLGLRWPSISRTTQQPTESWRSKQEGYWGGRTTWAERVGRTPYHRLGWQTKQQKNKNKNKKRGGLKWLPINISNTTINQKHAGVIEERKARRFDRGGVWGKHDSIVLVAKESRGMQNNKINLL